VRDVRSGCGRSINLFFAEHGSFVDNGFIADNRFFPDTAEHIHCTIGT